MTLMISILQAEPCPSRGEGISGFGSAVIGAVVALLIFVLSQHLQNKRTIETEKRQRQHDAQSLAAALYAEIAGLTARYYGVLGGHVQNATRPQDLTAGYVNPRFDYFTIFDSNAPLLVVCCLANDISHTCD
jgi:hypothetical protein